MRYYCVIDKNSHTYRTSKCGFYAKTLAILYVNYSVIFTEKI